MNIVPVYLNQVALLLRILPYVAKETHFALKGGTAINLFMRDFPRLSVDVDLVYLPLDDRQTALANISDSLNQLKEQLNQNIEGIHIRSVPLDEGRDIKIVCQYQRAQVKIEVNAIMRGHLNPVQMMRLSSTAEQEFSQFASMNVLSHGEVYGGKICAALDRQHPRDLFDIKLLFENEGLSDEIRVGFINALLSHPRPIHEVLKPNFVDQKETYNSQFSGMSFIPFTYEDFELTREKLRHSIHTLLTDTDKKFLLSFKEGKPNWSLSADFEKFKNMPAVQWKLLNIQKLKAQNPKKHLNLCSQLEKKLG